MFCGGNSLGTDDERHLQLAFGNSLEELAQQRLRRLASNTRPYGNLGRDPEALRH